MVKHISEKDFESEIKSSKVVVVDFFATWCGPCSMLAPILEEISSSRSENTKIIGVDVDENSTLASRFGIDSIPTLLFFKNGKLVKNSVGLVSKEQILNIIEEI